MPCSNMLKQQANVVKGNGGLQGNQHNMKPPHRDFIISAKFHKLFALRREFSCYQISNILQTYSVKLFLNSLQRNVRIMIFFLVLHRGIHQS